MEQNTLTFQDGKLVDSQGNSYITESNLLDFSVDFYSQLLDATLSNDPGHIASNIYAGWASVMLTISEPRNVPKPLTVALARYLKKHTWGVFGLSVNLPQDYLTNNTKKAEGFTYNILGDKIDGVIDQGDTFVSSLKPYFDDPPNAVLWNPTSFAMVDGKMFYADGTTNNYKDWDGKILDYDKVKNTLTGYNFPSSIIDENTPTGLKDAYNNWNPLKGDAPLPKEFQGKPIAVLDNESNTPIIT